MDNLFKNSEDYKIVSYPDKPLLEIRPKTDKTINSLREWIQINYKSLQKVKSELGGILFKGFEVKNAKDFDVIALSAECNLCDRHDFDDGIRLWLTKYIYEAAPYFIEEDKMPLRCHNEDAFVSYMPSTVMLCCIKPASFGGETVLVDCKKAFLSLPENLKEKLTRKKIKNTFTLNDSTFLINSGIPKNEEEISKLAKKYGAVSVERIGHSKTKFVFKKSVILEDESTKEPLLNSLYLPSSLVTVVDIWNAYKYRYGFLNFLKCLYLITKIIIPFCTSFLSMRNKSSEEELYDATFEDGEKLSVMDQLKICHAFWKNAIIEPLEAGDILILNNFSVTHGRLPYKGKRQVLSCIGNQIDIPDISY